MTARAPSMTLEFFSATDTGRARSNNEDSVAVDEATALVVLADGMGGYNAGEVASGMATTVIVTEMRQILTNAKPYQVDEKNNQEIAARLVREQVLKANTSIYQAAQSQSQYAGMGTTLVVALWHDNQITVAHVGDSRLYRLRNDTLEQITRDHSLLQEQIDSGMITKEQARHAPNKNLVTRAVGIDPEVDAEVHSYAVQPGDIYLLCSDGLPDMVVDEDIENTLASLKSNLPLAAEQLVQQANDNGGRDNVSVILVRVLGDFPARTGWLKKMKSWF